MLKIRSISFPAMPGRRVVLFTPSALGGWITWELLSTQDIGGINCVNQPVDRLLLK